MPNNPRASSCQLLPVQPWGSPCLSGSQFPRLLEENNNAILLRVSVEIMQMERFDHYYSLMT